jgi:hypothetical protein
MLKPQFLEPFSEFAELEQLFSKTTFPHNTERFKGLEKNRCLTFGIIKNRITKKIEPSVISMKKPEIYSKLIEIGNKICPFKFTTIHVNKNVVSPRHKDSLVNKSPSVIVSFGDYTGGELLIEEDKVNIYNCKNHPLLFDGRHFFHWNNPIDSGIKYSIIFYNAIEDDVDKDRLNICIPTYKRSNKFKTIKMLEKKNIPSNWITIFVADDEEKELYQKVTGGKYAIIIGERGIKNQRNFISNYYPLNSIIVSMDDDITSIKHRGDTPLIEWLPNCVKTLRDSEYGILGFSPTSDSRHSVDSNKPQFTTGRYLICGACHMYKNDGHVIEIDIIDDYDRSMQYIKKSGKTIRYWSACIKTTFGKGEGGLQTYRNIDNYIESVNTLVLKYPEVKVKMKHQNCWGQIVPVVSL